MVYINIKYVIEYNNRYENSNNTLPILFYIGISSHIEADVQTGAGNGVFLLYLKFIKTKINMDNILSILYYITMYLFLIVILSEKFRISKFFHFPAVAYIYNSS